MIKAAKGVAWLKDLIGDLGVVPSIQEPMYVFCDNESAVGLTKEPNDHDTSRHIERKHHYIQRQVEEGKLVANHVSSEDNIVDPFTKGLSKIKHFEHARSIGLRNDVGF